MKKSNRGPKALSDLLSLDESEARRPQKKRDMLHVIDGETGQPVRSTDVTGKTKAERDEIGRAMMESYEYGRYFTRFNDGRED